MIENKGKITETQVGGILMKHPKNNFIFKIPKESFPTFIT